MDRMSSQSGTLANLMATIDSVAAGGSLHDNDDDNVITTDLLEGHVSMLEGTVLHLSDGQSINVMQMSGSLEDAINVVQVETTEFDHDDVTTVTELCEIDIDTEEQQHILSETGAHVVVNTETVQSSGFSFSDKNQGQSEKADKSASVSLPTTPFSFPGQTFDVKCQKLILNVWDFFRRVKKNPDLLDEIRTPQERAAAALHISAATIGKIGKNFRRTGKLEAPGLRRKRAKPVVDSVTPEQERVIRAIIKELKENRVVPTIPLILSECRERINFPGGHTSFRRVLNRMGIKGLTRSPYAMPPPPPSIVKKQPTSASTSSSALSTTLLAQIKAANANQQKKSVEPIIRKESVDSYVSIPLTNSPVPAQSFIKKASFSKTRPTRTLSFSNNLKSPPASFSKQNTSTIVNSLFHGDNFIQLKTNSKGESVMISQEVASAIASATEGGGEEPHTIHVLQPDNTIQQIQIVYANLTS